MHMGSTGLSLVLMSLGACASTNTDGPGRSATCKPDAVGALVGMIAPDDAGVLGRTGGTIVRRIAPGDPTTKDFRVERVTITVADGRIVAASCG